MKITNYNRILMKNKKYCTVVTVPKPNKKIVERDRIDTLYPENTLT
jgi:hypothetical protein